MSTSPPRTSDIANDEAAASGRSVKARRKLRRRASGTVLLLAGLLSAGVITALLTPKAQVAVADPASQSQAMIDAGKQLYDTSCISCHGSNLQGVEDRGPSLIGVGDGAHDEGHGDGGHDDDGHADHPRSSDGANEHVFYSLTAVRKTADALAVALARHSPAHAADYRRNAAAFGKQLDDLQGKLAGISARHRGAKVAQTEPLAGYLITAAGLVDASPPGFTAAVENGQSPSAADRAKLEDLLTSHTAKALLYNAQAVNPVTTAVADTARRAGVPVVTLTESLPVGVTTYAQWQGAQIDALARALGS